MPHTVQIADKVYEFEDYNEYLTFIAKYYGYESYEALMKAQENNENLVPVGIPDDAPKQNSEE